MVDVELVNMNWQPIKPQDSPIPGIKLHIILKNQDHVGRFGKDYKLWFFSQFR